MLLTSVHHGSPGRSLRGIAFAVFVPQISALATFLDKSAAYDVPQLIHTIQDPSSEAYRDGNDAYAYASRLLAAANNGDARDNHIRELEALLQKQQAAIQSQQLRISELEMSHCSTDGVVSSIASDRQNAPPTPIPPITSLRNVSTEEVSGVTENRPGDLSSFLYAVITNTVTLIIYLLIGGCLIQRYPLVYSRNTLTLKDYPDLVDDYADERVPPEVKKPLEETWQVKIGNLAKVGGSPLTFFGWWTASGALNLDAVAECRGLDMAMFLRFTELAMKILLVVGLPILLILSPCHWLLGGYRAGKPNDPSADKLSYLGLANVKDDHPWLYWVHAFVVWYVVYVVVKLLEDAMNSFVKKRKKWLLNMPEPRCKTLLVEGIPNSPQEMYCTDERLKEYFENCFGPGSVKDVWVIRDSSVLFGYKQKRDKVDAEVHQLRFKLKIAEKDNKDDEKKGLETEMQDKQKQLQAIQDKMQELQAEIQPNCYVSRRAFVTFTRRRDAELANMVSFDEDDDKFVVCTPPELSDIRWMDLQMSSFKEEVLTVIGYALIAGVFWIYLPMVIYIQYYTDVATLAKYSTFFEKMLADESETALWNGMVGPLILSIVIGFIPTIFGTIFSMCMKTPSGNAIQGQIQEWYFYFQVTFVLLATAIGNDFASTLKHLAEDPLNLPYLLATTLPLVTHFYLTFIPVQWVTKGSDLCRLGNVIKFNIFAPIYGDAVAISKIEPEDQDYHGIGARSARITFSLILVLTYCSTSPLINVLGLVDFLLTRRVYGFLVVFCETKKPDLGGCFFVNQLDHVFKGLLIFILLMTGLFQVRSSSPMPGCIAAASLIYLFRMYIDFKRTRWDELCMEDLKSIDKMEASKEKQSSMLGDEIRYKQPEVDAIPLVPISSGARKYKSGLWC